MKQPHITRLLPVLVALALLFCRKEEPLPVPSDTGKVGTVAFRVHLPVNRVVDYGTKATQASAGGIPQNHMFGWLSPDEAGSESPVYIASDKQFDVYLKRLVAMVTVAFDRNDNVTPLDDYVTITPTRIALKNVPATMRLGENKITAAGTSIAEGDLVEDPTGVSLDLSSHTTSNPALFLYENRQPNGVYTDDQTMKIPAGHTAANLHTNYTCSYLEVTANYSDITPSDPKAGTITYRFFLGKNVTDNFDVERNTHYKVTLVLKGKARSEVTWTVSNINDGGFLNVLSTSGTTTSTTFDIPVASYAAFTPLTGSRTANFTVQVSGPNGSFDPVVVTVRQIPKIINPVGIYGQYDNTSAREIVLQVATNESFPLSFAPLVSKGSWQVRVLDGASFKQNPFVPSLQFGTFLTTLPTATGWFFKWGNNGGMHPSVPGPGVTNTSTLELTLTVNGNPNASLLVGWTNVVKNVFNWNVTTNNRDPCPSGYVVATSGQYTTLASGSMVPRQRRTPNLPLEERL
ncbi:MAG TPA: hypothetical protein PLM86_03725 [Bacteroidales bacterium]|nr:MAG: hypothetical protein BWX93_00907 [Bacteroidetes bacterium ADurb.Bin139]HOG25279.1 hypothetical protein [Bacteroidales bacterium]HOR11173.1 hypothetical protein [Bacteroidales bacterium]HOZ19821.1 hypothetical protein [Bacteroidales bacterium]HPK38695.1 hypothetical protein [Bacteroidales bacterium]